MSAQQLAYAALDAWVLLALLGARDASRHDRRREQVLPLLGFPVVPFYPFLWEGFPIRIDYGKRVP